MLGVVKDEDGNVSDARALGDDCEAAEGSDSRYHPPEYVSATN